MIAGWICGQITRLFHWTFPDAHDLFTEDDEICQR